MTKKQVNPLVRYLYVDIGKIKRRARLGRKKQQIAAAIQLVSKIKSDQDNIVKRNMEMFEALSRNKDIRVAHTLPAEAWIEDYKQYSIDYRAYLLQSTLKGLALIEGARQASKNLTDDYGFSVTLDYAELAQVAKNVTHMDLLSRLLSESSLAPSMRNKTLENAAITLFGPEKHRNSMADMLRNLSVPDQSPFGASGLLRMSDPQMQQKMQQYTGDKPLHNATSNNKSLVTMRRDVDKIAKDLQQARRDRISERVDR